MVALPDLTARIRVDTTDLEGAVGRAAKSGSLIGSALGSAVGNLAAQGLSRAASGIAGFASGSVDAFARVEDALGAAGVQFGSGLGTIERFAAGAAQGFGISKGAALDAANTFGTLGKSAGLQGEPLAAFSTKFAGLAGDLASFKGTSTEQAIEAVGAALRGESEPIRAYGVLLDDASLRQEALAQGLIKTTKEALTPQQKVLATQALILKQTTDAQGDYARTSDSTANTQKTLAAEMENAQAALGEKLAPAVTALRGGFLELVRGASGLIDTIGRIATAVQPVVAAFAAQLQPALAQVVPAVRAFIDAIPLPVLQGLGVVLGVIAAAIVTQTVATAAASLATGAWAAVTGPFVVTKNAEGVAIARGTVARLAHNVATVASTVATVAWTAATHLAAGAMKILTLVMKANPFVRVALLLTALGAALVAAYQNSETFREVVQRAFEAVKAAGQAVATFVTETIPAAFEAVKQRVGDAVTGMRDALQGAWDAIKAAVTAVFDAIKAYFEAVFEAYRTIIEGAWELIKGVVEGAAEGVKTVVTTVFDAVKGFIERSVNGWRTLIESAWGAIRGVVEGAVGAVRGLVEGGFERVRAAIDGAMATARGLVEGAWRAIRGAVEGGIGAVLGLVGGLPGKITSRLGNLSRLLVSAGGDLLRGLGEGIRGAVGAVVERAKEAARKVVNGVKNALGISSPSKVMAREVGAPMAEGIAAGIAGSRGAVQAALDAVTSPDIALPRGLGVQATAAKPAAAAAAPAGQDPGEVPSVALLEAIVGELGELRAEVRRQTERHLLFSRTAEVAVGG